MNMQPPAVENPQTPMAERERRLAHDLRNALGAMKNAAHLIRLRTGGNDPAVARAVGIIDAQVATMVRLLEAPAGAPTPAPAPVAAAAAPTVPATPHAVRGARLLLVDDSEAVRDTFAEILGDAGYEVRTAGDGESALAQAHEWMPDAVMLDIHIPGRNGYEVAAALRARYAADELKLIMFSGMRLDEVTLRESQRRGFDYCFDKTGDFAELDAWLQASVVPRATA
jgi:CheY-like chemotaxis protein